jgi:hypothetical protein
VVDILKGVCFSFNLDILPTLPEEIRIYERDFGGTDQFKLIGSLKSDSLPTESDFVTLKGVRTLRGSAVWVADVVGEYEVQAAVLDGTGTVIASETRRVEVEVTNASTIQIVSGFPSPPASSPTAQPAAFKTVVTGDVARVEFFDSGVLIGSDQIAPFGDEIEDPEENDYDFLRGTHNITAKAFDTNGRTGETVAPFQVIIRNGNARPTLKIDSPPNGFVVALGPMPLGKEIYKNLTCTFKKYL